MYQVPVKKLESLDFWESTKEELRMLALLLEIKNLGNNHGDTQYPELGVHNNLKRKYTLRRGPETAVVTHLEQ